MHKITVTITIDVKEKDEHIFVGDPTYCVDAEEIESMLNGGEADHSGYRRFTVELAGEEKSNPCTEECKILHSGHFCV